jgi:hypothetical protein
MNVHLCMSAINTGFATALLANEMEPLHMYAVHACTCTCACVCVCVCFVTVLLINDYIQGNLVAAHMYINMLCVCVCVCVCGISHQKHTTWLLQCSMLLFHMISQGRPCGSSRVYTRIFMYRIVHVHACLCMAFLIHGMEIFCRIAQEDLICI